MTDPSTHLLKKLIDAIKAENIDEVRSLAAEEGFDVNAADEVLSYPIHTSNVILLLAVRNSHPRCCLYRQYQTNGVSS